MQKLNGLIAALYPQYSSEGYKCAEFTEQQRKVLIERAKHLINWMDVGSGSTDEYDIQDVDLARIALAALTAPPVKLPHYWVYIRFKDRSKSQRMKCQLAWSDSRNSVIYDEEGVPLLLSNSAFEVIGAAGYEVQE